MRIGIIGCGVIASAHASSLKGLSAAGLADVEITAVYDADRERAERFGRYFEADVAAGMEEVAARSDAVYVCTSTKGHLEAVAAAAGVKRAIFCEKPLGRNLDEALTIAGVGVECRRAGPGRPRSSHGSRLRRVGCHRRQRAIRPPHGSDREG